MSESPELPIESDFDSVGSDLDAQPLGRTLVVSQSPRPMITSMPTQGFPPKTLCGWDLAHLLSTSP